MGIMIRYRYTTWFSCLSILLVAVFVQAQVSGCCKLGTWFRSAVSVAEAAPIAASPEHACCPKKSEAAQESGTAPEAAAHACATSDHGCCLQGSGLNASGLVSIPGGPSFDVSLPSSAHVLGILPATDALSRFDLARMDSGPPETRAQLPLLI